MKQYSKLFSALTTLCLLAVNVHAAKSIRVEVVKPITRATFDKGGKCRERQQGGNARTVNGYLVFDASMDGNRQVDPQIAVGGGFILHATNGGIIIYDKNGKQVAGTDLHCFGGGIDPKLFFDVNNRIFAFSIWKYWDKVSKKPIHVSVSATDDPRGAWNTYAITAPDGVDGGGLGQSTKWIGYTYPSRSNNSTFVFSLADAKAGKPIRIYHFAEHFGQPAFTRDKVEDLYFLKVTSRDLVITRIKDNGKGEPVSEVVAVKPHGLQFVGRPPQTPQKGTQIKTASGDNNPKNLVLRNGFLWFSHTVNCHGHAAVQWHQVQLDGTIVQSGLISDKKSGYIQTTLAVNSKNDVLVGFQECNSDMFISPRMAYRRAADPPGTLRGIIDLGEGQGATDGVAWGDYSGSAVDGDNQLDLWTIQSITDEAGKGDCLIAKLPATDTTKFK
jgi:hypothetical protein